jgi:hypothetical protein
MTLRAQMDSMGAVCFRRSGMISGVPVARSALSASRWAVMLKPNAASRKIQDSDDCLSSHCLNVNTVATT